MIRAGSLFSGIGCVDVALERAGVRIAWQVEIDKDCRRVLDRHWPGVPKYEDVRDVDGRELEPVDLICAGWPCQDLSVAGLRAGLAGERSGLFVELMRIVVAVRPRWLVFENVPGLLSSFSPVEPPPGDLPEGQDWEVEETSDLGVVLSCLGELGYGWAYRSLDAQYYSVAQRRERVYIVGCLGDARRAAEVLFESESCSWHPAPSRAAGARVAATITSGVGVTGNAPGRRREDDTNIVACLRSNQYCDHGGDESKLVVYQCQGTNVGEMGALRQGNGHVTGGVPFIAHTLKAEGAGASEDGTGRGVPIVAVAFSESGQGWWKDGIGALRAEGENRPSRPSTVLAFDWQAGHGNDTSFRGKSRSYVVRKGEYTGALQENKRDAVMHGMAVRRLTPLECSRLMSLPDWWLDIPGLSDSAKYRMLGNGVVVNVVSWIASRILALEAANA